MIETVLGRLSSRLTPWLAGFRSRPLVPSLVSGAVVALIACTFAVSFSALIFGGDLAEWIPYGVGLGLLSAAILSCGAALTSPFPGNITTPQDLLASIIALMAAALADRLRGHASPEEIGRTVLAAIALCSLLIGAAAFLLGRFRLGNLVRFIPYPVVGGFLAGSGWVLFAGSFRVMTGRALDWGTLPFLLRPGTAALWLPGLLFGVLLWAVLRWRPHTLAVPLLLAGATGLFYAVVALAGVPLARLREAGWLFEELPSVQTAQLHFLPTLAGVHWDAIAGQGGFFAAIVLTAIISILLNTSAMEITADREIDLNRELRSVGLVHLAGGAFSCMPGFISISLSRIPLQLRGSGRLAGLVCAVLCATALFFGNSFLTAIPKFVLGGFLLYIGLVFLVEWIVDAWRRLPRADYAVMLLIVVVVAAVGYLQGIAVGIVAASALFLIGYSRVDVVARCLSGAEQRSNVDRAGPQARLLDEKGAELLILQLQGFLFFGSADQLYGTVRDRLARATAVPLRFVLLDFSRVMGIDSSAILGLVKMRRLGEKSGFRLVLVSLTTAVQRQLVAGELLSGEGALLFPDRDHGLEWCEDQLLLDATLASPAPDDAAIPLFFLDGNAVPGSAETRLTGYLPRLELAREAVLLRQGDASGELYFLTRGRLRVELELGRGRVARLRSLREGTVVGELGFCLGQPRSTTVRAETDCILHRLDAGTLRRIEAEDPEAALLFHHAMSRLLAERVIQSNRTLSTMLD